MYKSQGIRLLFIIAGSILLNLQLSNAASLKQRRLIPDSKTTLEFVPIQVVYEDEGIDSLRGRNLEPLSGEVSGPPVDGGPPQVVTSGEEGAGDPPPQQNDEDDEEDDDEDDNDEDDEEESEDKDDEEDEDEDDEDKSEKPDSKESNVKNVKPPKKSISLPLPLPKQRRPLPEDEQLPINQESISPGEISEARLLFSGNHWNGYGTGMQYGGFSQGNGILGNYFGHGYSHHNHMNMHGGYHHGGHGQHGGHAGHHQTTYHNGFYTTVE